MNKKTIPVEKAFAKWRQELGYQTHFDDLEKEFALASAVIDARTNASITQERKS